MCRVGGRRRAFSGAGGMVGRPRLRERAMFLARLFRFLLLVLLAAWLVRLGRRLFAPARSAPLPETPSGRHPKQLHRDPACGRYVPAEISHPLKTAEQTLHFCSRECLDRYRQSS